MQAISHSLLVLGRFLLHQATGSAVFVLIFVPIIALNRFAHYLSENTTDQFIRGLVTLAEYSAALGDTVLFGVFLYVVLVEAIRDLRSGPIHRTE